MAYWESTNQPGIDFGILTLTDYDEYLTQKFTGSTTLQPDTTTSSTLPTVMSPFVTNVKLDVKQYPIFKEVNAHWPKFKHGVLALASTHGLDDVFGPKFVVPDPTDPTWSTYNEKNKFVYSI